MIKDPRTAWFAHRSVRVGTIFFGFDWCLRGAGFWRFCGSGVGRCEFLKNFVMLVRCGPEILAPTGSGEWIPGYDINDIPDH